MTRIHAAALFAVALLVPLGALAHFPPTPDTNCNPSAAVHDYVRAAGGGATVDDPLVTMQGATVGGSTLVPVDGSVLPCGFRDFCAAGSDFAEVDPSGDDLPDGTDPSGDNVVVPCSVFPAPLQNLDVPLGDGEFEFAYNGASLAKWHHGPWVQVTDGVVPGVHFMVGSDGDGDLVVDAGNPDDCLTGIYFIQARSPCYETEGDYLWVFLLDLTEASTSPASASVTSYSFGHVITGSEVCCTETGGMRIAWGGDPHVPRS
ncbi:MAG TPA: hypothetical protein VHH36_09890 [Candidatus Thermoplasmatota archaeon]|nr:hypothetical protein [Candidatus Thermoplasmatota archaeon]